MILILGIILSSAATFALVVSDFSWQNMVVALALSSALLYLFRRQLIPHPLPPNGLALHLIVYSPALIWFLLVDIIKGTWQVLVITIGLRPLAKPGIVKIPINVHFPSGVGPVGFFVTLSPGTFLVDIDWEEKVMLVHAIDASNPNALRKDAEKYYRLWEYGDYLPEDAREERGEEDGRDA